MRGRSLRRHFEMYAIVAPGAAGRRPQARRQRQRRLRHRARGRARSLPRAVRERRRRAAPGDADQHPRRAATTRANRFVPARRRRTDPTRATTAEALRAACANGSSAAKSETAIGAAEGLAVLLTGLPTALLVAMTRAQTRTTDFAATNLRGSPVPLYIAGARVLANYPVRSAHGHRAQRDGAQLLRRPPPRAQHRPGRDHRRRRVHGATSPTSFDALLAFA